MSTRTEGRVAGRRALTLVVVATAGAAWVALAVAGHHGTGILAWIVMVLAMMLPPALPMLDTVRRLVSAHRRPGLLLLAGGTAFVGVWTAAGAVLLAADALLRALWPHPSPVAAGVVLAAAGTYQLTPWKDACLRACRTPRGFAIAHWRGVRPAWVETATVTGAYGLACAGCCWALMAVSLAVAAAALPVMVALAVLMAAERLTRSGRLLAAPAGAALLVLAAATFLDISPLTH
jgi:predicted metal-binding membrane protein